MPKALYCNERNGWCGPTAAHRDAQESTKYDCVKEDQSHPVDTLVNAAMCDNSPPQMCRKMCPAMKCPANQCAMRTGSCCDFTCQATNGATPEEPIASDSDSEDGTTEDAANPQCTTGRRYNSNQVAVKGCRANVLPKGTKFCLNGETFTVGGSHNGWWDLTGIVRYSGSTVYLAEGEETKTDFYSEGDELTIGACATSEKEEKKDEGSETSANSEKADTDGMTAEETESWCKKWCYGKKHKNRPWYNEEQEWKGKCRWKGCSKCEECNE